MRARRATTAALAVALGAGLAFAAPAGADVGDNVTGGSDGDSATGTAETVVPGSPASAANGGNGGSGGPNCTKSDGTRDYLRYEGLQFTTMQEQREEIRPEEQRPGVYLHEYCGDEYVGFDFYPDEEGAAPVDPARLARSVTITPPAPVLATSPGAGDHLVGVEAWFWAENWDPVTGSAQAGSVTVTVTAAPSGLVVDPGDGSPAFTCTGQPPAYDPGVPARSQRSSCTHVYEVAGHYEATATLVYDVSFTSNVGVSGQLDAIEPSSTTALTVNEAQAVGND